MNDCTSEIKCTYLGSRSLVYKILTICFDVFDELGIIYLFGYNFKVNWEY